MSKNGVIVVSPEAREHLLPYEHVLAPMFQRHDGRVLFEVQGDENLFGTVANIVGVRVVRWPGGDFSLSRK